MKSPDSSNFPYAAGTVHAMYRTSPQPQQMDAAAYGFTERFAYSRHQVLFRNGTPADKLYFIESGEVRVTMQTPQFKQGTVALLRAGDFCGEECLDESEPLRTKTATCISNAQISRIGRTAAAQLIQNNASFNRYFVRFLMNAKARGEEALMNKMYKTCEQQLVNHLLMFSGVFDGKPLPQEIDAISHEELAMDVGTNRTFISVTMNRLRRMGRIDYTRKKITINPSLLASVLEE